MIKYGIAKIENNGLILGNGTIYTYKGSTLESLTNTIYIRQYLKASLDVNLEYEQVLYDNKIHHPKVLAYVSDLRLDDNYFNINYENGCIRAGHYAVDIEVQNQYDKYFIGSTTKYFDILSNIKTISTSDEFKTSSFDIDIYDRYELASNIVQTEAVVIPDYAIFDMKSYRITNIGLYEIRVSSNTDILIDIYNENDFDKYYSEVTYLALKTKLDKSKALRFQDSSYFKNKRNQAIIDFNGYNLNNCVYISSLTDYSIKFINSSNTVSKIVDSDNNASALSVDGGDSKSKANVDFKFEIEGKFKISGIRLRYSIYGTFDFSAKGIDVDLSTRVQDPNSKGVIIYGRTTSNTKIKFTNCKINAYTAFSAQRGFDMTVTNCSIIATGELNINSGSCVILDRYIASEEEYANLTFTDTSFKSLYGYGILVRTANNNYYSIKDNYCTWNCKKGKIEKYAH
ncbi:MAG: hypothetical protein K6G28_03355 [Acholeplasmatales bacterium]|nr:hypothetical protein [Acholeplasmatales bacterium]